MVVSIIPAAFAAAPSTLTIAKLASGSSAVATTLEDAIKAGTNNSGVYSDVIVPREVAVGTYAMGVEDYILMAAQAINDIAGGSANTTAIAYKDVALTGDTAQGVNLTQITKGQIVDLARRVEKYGLTLSELATSYNRPSDGTATYEGRICIYSIGSIFAQALAAYSANGSLPASVTFTPSDYTTNETSAPQVPPTEPEPTEPPVPDVYSQVLKVAKDIVATVKDKGILPTSATVNGTSYTMAEIEHLMLQMIVNINNGNTNTLEFIDLADAANPSESITSGSINLTEYIDMAGRNLTWNRANPAAANYTTTSLGRMHYYERVHFNAKILASYAENGVLPASMKTGSWYDNISATPGDATFGNDFSAYAKFLVPTNNCQSNNATIINLAKVAMYCPSSQSNQGRTYANPSTTYEAMWNITEYINYHTTYEGYANTSRGALKTWNDRAGNCCDMAHLMCALARSLGVPARYQHWWCQFSDHQDGHVFAGLYIPDAPSGTKGNDGNWFYADPVNNSCYLGYQTFRLMYTCSADKLAELPW